MHPVPRFRRVYARMDEKRAMRIEKNAGQKKCIRPPRIPVRAAATMNFSAVAPRTGLRLAPAPA
jgi:hypothetical protein